MARTNPLTNTQVKQARPKDKIYKLSDGDGLQLRVRPNGAKSWLLDYIKPHSRKRSTIGLGTFPSLSLSDARKLREYYRSLLAKGVDPKEHKDNEHRVKLNSSSNTLSVVARKWFEVKRTTVSEGYAEDIWSSLENHILKRLGSTPIEKINAPSTIESLKPLSARGNFETLKRVCQRLNEVMIYAVNTGLVYSNPLAGIKSAFPSPTTSNMPSLNPKELPTFLNDLNYAQIKLTTRLLIEWQLHTMVRPSEAAGARWREIDLQHRVWVIPPERMKRRREHIVPLSNQTIELLHRLKSMSSDNNFVFPSDRTPNMHINSQTANMAIKRMGYSGRLVAHGLRSIASTVLNENEFDPDIIEVALAHVDKNQVRRAYNRAKYLERRREMMQWWSDYIERASKQLPFTSNSVSQS